VTSTHSISKSIVSWYQKNKRDLPWRNTKDPYLIWLSEIILQQTRVEQGLPYYERFSASLSSVKKFAAASEHDILKMWQGLGYYSRARNMHKTAKQVVETYGGKFPETYTELKQLKGIGDYTAAAIASFAFNLPHAVLDGNVYRLLSRFFGIETPIDTPQAKKQFAKLADDLMDKKNAALHNQAMMEMGAMVCKPKNPICDACPLALSCSALEEGTISLLPVKSKKTVVRHRYFYYFLIQSKNKLIINHRSTNDIWKNMYDLPLIETKKKISVERIISSKEFKSNMHKIDFSVQKVSEPIIHKLSHQHLNTIFITLKCEQLPPLKETEKVIVIKDLSKYAFPRLIESFLLNEKLLAK
jgi:A/G-specific adenine glycosylase